MIPSTSSSDRIPAAAIVSVDLKKPAAPAPDQDQDQDSLSTEKAEQLRTALASQPEVRPEVVARGRALAADPNYPPASVIRGIASQILASPDLSEDPS
jgi:hypothetical protein